MTGGEAGAVGAMPDISVRRMYRPEELETAAGHRVLVDRLWPRGVRKEGAPLDEWLRDVAPSTDLRRWYGHEPQRFAEFAGRYRHELASTPASGAVGGLLERAGRGPLVLVTATRDVEHSGAAVLRDHLVRLAGGGRAGGDCEGGDPACWADQVCDGCGQMVEGPHQAHHCPGGSR